MTHGTTCSSCGGARVTKTTTTIDRRTGKPAKALNLIGGIAFSAFAVVLLWLGVSVMTTPLPEGSTSSPLYYLALGVMALVGGLRLIVGYLRADRVKRLNYRCIDCDHRWYGWEDGAGVTDEEVRGWRLRALEGDDVNARRQAIKALGTDRDAQALQPLIESLQASGLKNLNVRADAAEALGRIGHPDAVEPLIQAMEDGQALVRINATRALGEIGGARARNALSQALQHKHKDVQKAAEEALQKIKAAEASSA